MVNIYIFTMTFNTHTPTNRYLWILEEAVDLHMEICVRVRSDIRPDGGEDVTVNLHLLMESSKDNSN